ncbi:hypothetical protein X801_07740, partial [Opisthorchis viverrini]
ASVHKTNATSSSEFALLNSQDPPYWSPVHQVHYQQKHLLKLAKILAILALNRESELFMIEFPEDEQTRAETEALISCLKINTSRVATCRQENS